MDDGAPDTRTALMDAAESLVLERGFAGATVDAIAGGAGVSKGAFFHHFSSKDVLARALVEREAERELRRTERLLERAEEVSGDPLIQVLITVTLLEEELGRADEAAGGDDDADGASGSVRAILSARGSEARAAAREASAPLLRRRELLAERLEAAARRHPAVGDVDARALAELLEVILEGARLLERAAPDAPRAGAAERPSGSETPGRTGADTAGGTSREAGVLPRQLAAYREYLELLFSVNLPGSEPR